MLDGNHHLFDHCLDILSFFKMPEDFKLHDSNMLDGNHQLFEHCLGFWASWLFSRASWWQPAGFYVCLGFVLPDRICRQGCALSPTLIAYPMHERTEFLPVCRISGPCVSFAMYSAKYWWNTRWELKIGSSCHSSLARFWSGQMDRRKIFMANVPHELNGFNFNGQK